jgi:hypothetical protein
MSQSITTDTDAAPPPAPKPAWDPDAHDPARASATLLKLRGIESQLTKENQWLRNSLQAMAAGRPPTVEQQAAIDVPHPSPPPPRRLTRMGHWQSAPSLASAPMT